jgi:hypothetical protein
MSGLVRVWTDVGQRKPKPLLARIVSKTSKFKTIQYLSPTETRIKGKTIYSYEEDTYQVDDDSIYEYLTESTEFDMGFTEVDGGYVKEESDEDYVPSDESGDEEDDDGTDDDVDTENEEEYEYEDESDYVDDD